MYLPENPEIINYYKQQPPPQLIVGAAGNVENNRSPTENHDTIKFFAAAPVKKRAEIWVKEETQALINLRREIDSLFNTSKSNKHLWDQISLKMREKGFDRSPSMCTDKWRNLLKEFKKAKQQEGGANSSGSSANSKMLFYKEIEEIISNRNKDGLHSTSKVDSFMQFSDKGIEDTGITFGPREVGFTANGRGVLNLERCLDQDGHPLAITVADTVAASGVAPWNWRETRGNGEHSNTYGGRVIMVKFRDHTRRIGIDGTPEAIIDVIKAVFGLRSKRAFWLEDEDNIVRTIDRDMPLGNYTLHVDEGITIKVCVFEEPNHMPVRTIDMTFYSEDGFRGFLARQGWTCLRECSGYRTVDRMVELCPGGIYQGVR